MATDCDCGEPDCPRGKAIRAEFQRRRMENGETDNPTINAYMLLRRQFMADVQSGVSKGTLEAGERLFKDLWANNEANRNHLTAIIALGIEAAITHMWHSSPLYKFVWLPIKFIFVLILEVVEIVLRTVFHLVAAVPGFFYAAFRRKSVRRIGLALFKRRLIAKAKGLPEFLRITEEDLKRYGDDRLWEDVLASLPVYLRWGVAVGDWWQDTRLYKWLKSRNSPPIPTSDSDNS
jgi:hypothetical protein